MASITPPSRPIGRIDASPSYSVKTVCLQNWWLIKAENDFDGRRLGIAGQTSQKHQAVREFKSAPILKRHDIFTLETVDGVFILMEGYINEDRTKENGFPPEVFNHFVFGFPPLWEEYAKKWCGKEPTNEDASKNQSLGRISTDPGVIHDLEDAASEKSTSSFREGDISRSQDNLVDSSNLAVNPSDAEIHSLEDAASEKSTSSFREGDISRSQDNLVDSSKLAVNPSGAEIHSLEDAASEKSTSSFREGDISRSQDNLVDSSKLAVNPSGAEIHSLEDAALEKTTSRSQDNLGDPTTLAVNLSVSAGAKQGSLQELSPGKKALEENIFMSNSPNTTPEVENTNHSSPIVAEKELPGSPEQVDNHKQTSLAKNTMGKKRKKTVEISNSKSVKLCASTGQQGRPVTRSSIRKEVLVAEAICLPKNNSKINGTVRSSVRFAVAEGNVDSNTVVNKTVKHATNSTKSLKTTKRKLNYESPVTPKRTFVSPESSSPKRSRSGRLLLPTMEFWRNQTPIYDKNRTIIGVQQDLHEKKFVRGSVSEPPRKKRK